MRKPDLAALDAARTEAQTWLAQLPDLTSATDGELIASLDTFRPRQAASMKRLLQFSMLAGAPRGLLDKTLDRPGVAAGMANRIVGGTRDIDSAQLAQRLWTLGRLVADDAALTAQFDLGLEGIAARTRGTVLEGAVEAFLADHGHRCNDEYELATPAWVMDPAPVYAAIDRLRHASADRDPVTTGERLAVDAEHALDETVRLLPRRLRWMTRRYAVIARLGSIGRERAKDILVLENLGARRVLHELVRRAAARGGPADVRLAFCITFDELARSSPGRRSSRSSLPSGRRATSTWPSGYHRPGSRVASPTPRHGRCAATCNPRRPRAEPRSRVSPSPGVPPRGRRE